MSRWDPSPEWLGEDAYIIGGGPSLRDFDWGLIRGKNTVGCNGAFLLGVDICKILVWCDLRWWEEIGSKRLPEYGGRVVGCCSKISRIEPCPSWLLSMDRHRLPGLSKTELAWIGNTGGCAVNLALILGARRVFLLGFDMQLAPEDKKTKELMTRLRIRENDGRANWHDERYEAARADSYPRFAREFGKISKTLPKVFPGCEVINITDNSNLAVFPKVTLADHFQLKVVA